VRNVHRSGTPRATKTTYPGHLLQELILGLVGLVLDLGGDALAVHRVHDDVIIIWGLVAVDGLQEGPGGGVVLKVPVYL